jgi:hypothetical protein
MYTRVFLLLIISSLPVGVAAETQAPDKWFPLKSAGLTEKKPAEIAAMPKDVAFMPLNRSAVRTGVRPSPPPILPSAAARGAKKSAAPVTLDALQAQQIHDIFNIQ